MRGLFGIQKAPLPAKERAGDVEPLQGNSRQTAHPDLEAGACHSVGSRTLPPNDIPPKDTGTPPSDAARAAEHMRRRAYSLGGGGSASGNLSMVEGEVRGVFASRKRATGAALRRTDRGGPRGSSRWGASMPLRDSTPSLSLSKRDFTRSSSSRSGAGALTWWEARRRTLARLFCYTGRLGLKVYPATLAFKDKDIEHEWLAMRAEHGAKSFWWLGAIVTCQVCFDMIDRTAGGIPMDTIDGELIMLPTWLTIPLPCVLFILACSKWGRKNSLACLTVAFFLYSPLFLLYSARQRTRKITEFLLGRPLDFDFSLFVRRDPIISSSQPLLLVIAAYAVAMPYIWALAFCMWVSLWWTTVSVILPPSKRQSGVGNWFFLILSDLIFLLVTCFTIRSAVIASRHRFSMMRQAERDLDGIRQEAAALVEHSALGDLFRHISAAESCLREVKLAFPKEISHLEGVISHVLVYLVQAQICLSHLDDERPADPLSGTVHTWAVSRVPPADTSAKPTAAGSAGRDGISKKGYAAKGKPRLCVTPTDVHEPRRTSAQRSPCASSSDSSDAAPLLRAESTAEQFRKRSGDFVILGRRSSIGSLQTMEIATIDPKRRAKCSNYIKGLMERLRHVPCPVTDGEQGEGGNTKSGGSQPPVPSQKDIAKTDLKQFIGDSAHAKESPAFGFASDATLALLAEIGRVWEMDVFRLSQLTNGNVLPTVGIQLRRAFLSTEDAIPVDDNKWSTFLREVCIRYRKTPYHNERHAGTVAHMNVWLLRHTTFWDPLSPLQKLAVVVAALVHDVGHFGVNNSLLINSHHPLAITYNDRAVLENFHVSVAFRTMLFYPNGAANILEQLNAEQYKEERADIVELVLETDMASHFEFLTRFRLKMQVVKATLSRLANAEAADEDVDAALAEDASGDCWMVAKACIRCADIGHSSVNWEQHYQWSRALMREFFSQGKREAELGIPVSPICNEATTDVPKSQIGFIGFICQPLFAALEQADPSGSVVTVCLRQMRANSATWQRVADSGISWENAKDVAKYNFL